MTDDHTDRSTSETLDPDLEEYREGEQVWHPILYASICGHNGVASCNHLYRAKQLAVDKAFKGGDWIKYIFLHERPYRLDAFEFIEDGLGDAEYWKLLARIWRDSESIFANCEIWERLWNSDRTEKQEAMNNCDQDVFARLPAELTIYRGISGCQGAIGGLSWTLSREKALWFAMRRDREAHLITATAAKESVHAYLNTRNEQEVVTQNPTIVKVEDVTARTDINLENEQVDITEVTVPRLPSP
ncbi:hypothetical protein SAMN05443247_05931 [Bradyrhizobium erythrophlei]|jgi:hypothetical protein|nr:hypothetical protein SAMN05443247_05931 [Bradyrhizobium erythrophlei]